MAWLTPRRARLVFPRPKKGDEFDLGWWSVLDLGRSDYDIARSGPFAGMGLLRIPHDCYSIVRDRIVRDSIHPEAIREMELDCLECGACCRDNRVELEDQDIERFERAGRGELARAPYAKQDDGKVVLVLRRDKRCKHLADDNRCGVYPIRPDAMQHVPGGERSAVLSSREGGRTPGSSTGRRRLNPKFHFLLGARVPGARAETAR